MGNPIELVKLETRSLGDAVYECLENMILSRTIKPGERINESHLSNQLGVSRGPIREACRQLEKHGMVEMRSRKGTFVKEIDTKQIIDIYEIRAVLDQYAGEKAGELVEDDDLVWLNELIEVMKGAVARDDAKVYYQANLDFHNAIFGISGNGTLPEIYEGLIKRSALFRKASLSLPGRLSISLGHHQEICSALTNRDGVKAGQLMKEHVLDAKHVLIQSLEH